jgi:hypothetical protein
MINRQCDTLIITSPLDEVQVDWFPEDRVLGSAHLSTSETERREILFPLIHSHAVISTFSIRILRSGLDPDQPELEWQPEQGTCGAFFGHAPLCDGLAGGESSSIDSLIKKSLL